ncbi:NADH-cytochrome b5 reductase [Tulasnella sp. 331]|nr:NADH-cytochrome b5 reductase [Tulasnella sp. 331]
MPNSLQLVFVASSVISFASTAALVNYFFPGYLFPSNINFDYLLELVGRKPVPPATFLEQIQMSLSESLKELFTFNGPSDLLQADKMLLMAFTGGTGITPMYQIITHILYSPASTDNTKIHLIYANQAKEDILLKLELDELAARHKGRFDVHYVLERPGEGWTGGVGYVTKDMIKQKMAGYEEGVKTLMCGPPPMINAMKKNLVDLGFPPAQTISKADDAVFAF